MEKKGPYTIQELRGFASGQQVWGKYLVLELNNRKTKDGRNFSNIKLGDATGEIDVVAWDNCSSSGVIETGRVVGLLGDIGVYNGRLQIVAKRLKSLDDSPGDYLKGPASGVEGLRQDFFAALEGVEDPYLHKLLMVVFSESMQEKFFRAPAAKKIHHNYSGGLLEHTMNMVKLCRAGSLVYPNLNQDLLITGALLHDIGKVEELEIKVIPEYTTAGRLLGHIMIGCEILAVGLSRLRLQQEYFPTELELILRHIILSHHGSLEFGSPVKPLIPEAFFIYTVDNLDAKMHIFMDHINQDQDSSEIFTPYDNFHQQNFYKYRYQYQNQTIPDHNKGE